MAVASVSAIGVSQDDVSATLAQLSVSSASNLYGYEVNFSYSGSVSDVTFSGFLGGTTSSGYLTRRGYLYVYESKLDNTQTGVSGSGSLFQVTHSGDLEVCGLLAVYANGSEQSISYCDSNDGGSTNSTGGSNSTSGSSGGGGGGAGAVPVVASLTAAEAEDSVDFSVDELIVTAIIGRETQRSVTVKNNADRPVVMALSQEGFGETLMLPETLELAAGEEKSVPLIFVPTEQKVLTGKIIFDVGGERLREIFAIVNVRTENFLFDTLLTLGRQYRVVVPGEPIVAQVNLEQVGLPGTKVDVVAHYAIKDFSGNTFLEDSETFFVEDSKEYVKEFPTDQLPFGKYALSLEIVYPGAFATASAQFEVRENETPLIVWIVGVAVVVLALVGGVFFWAVHHKPASIAHGRRN
jgi:hypothetical protein